MKIHKASMKSYDGEIKLTKRMEQMPETFANLDAFESMLCIESQTYFIIIYTQRNNILGNVHKAKRFHLKLFSSPFLWHH